MIEHTEELNGYRLRIERDDDPPHPRRDNDYQSRMICFHRRYVIGDKHDFRYPDEVTNAIPEDAVKLPVYLYDHGGITISTKPFSCSWDSGQIGWIYITREGILMEQGDLSERSLDQALANLESEIQEYDQYLQGDVYGFQIERIVTCHCCNHRTFEHVESCGGFYGLEYAIEEGRSELRAHCTVEA